MNLSDYEYTYLCRTRCIFQGREWVPGDIFATNDPTIVPPHHFEGGVNPKDTEAVEALINERLGIEETEPPVVDNPPVADEDEDNDEADELGPLPYANVPAAERTPEMKAAMKAERKRRKELKK